MPLPIRSITDVTTWKLYSSPPDERLYTNRLWTYIPRVSPPFKPSIQSQSDGQILRAGQAHEDDSSKASRVDFDRIPSLTGKTLLWLLAS
jgi:hypothetical protein